MTLTIEVSGALEEALKAQASQEGVPADRVARQVLARALTPELAKESAVAETAASREEKAHAFREWAHGHRYTAPLSDEAISRGSMYPDRW